MSIGSHESPVAKTTTWLTPPELLAQLGKFDLDPCCPPFMPWQTATVSYSLPIDDGLVRPWFGRVWLNPPYGREVDAWMRRMHEHGNGIALTFARTETDCWHRYHWTADAILFLQGRLHFHYPDGTRAKANAGAPSALIAYGRKNAESLRTCTIRGAFVDLKNTA